MEPVKKKRNWIKKILKWIGITLGSIVVLLVLLWFVLKTAWAQNIIRKQAIAYLEKKLQTKVDIGRIDINYLYHLEIDGLYLEDKQKQPLAYIGKLEANYRLLDLLSNQITISRLSIDSIKLNVYNNSTDSLFNYDFISKAFSGPANETTVDTVSGGTKLKFKFKEIELNRADLRYYDVFGGQEYDIDFKKIDIDIRDFNLDSLFFRLDHLYTENINASIHFLASNKIKSADTSDNIVSRLPLIEVDSLQLADTRFIFNDEPGEMSLNTVAAKMGLSDLLCDLNKNNIRLAALVIKDHDTKFAMKSKSEEKKTENDSLSTNEKPFTFSVADLLLENNNIQFDDNKTVYRKSSKMDFGHLLFNGLNADIHNINYDGNEYKASVNLLKAKEQSGFELKQLKTIALYGEQKLKLENTVIETNRSLINANATAEYTSLSELSENLGMVKLEAGFKNTRINLNDLLYFQPDLAKNEYVQPLLTKNIFLNTSMKGKVNDLKIDQLIIKEGTTQINATAYITGLPETEKMKIDLRLNQFVGTREGLLSLLPKDLIPSSIHIPDQFNIKGTYNGTMDNMAANIQLASSSGNISVNGKIRNVKDSINSVYDAVVTTEDFRLDKFLGDTSFGAASVQVKVKGKGYAVKTADIEMEGDVKKLTAKGYTYTNAKIKGRLANNKVNATLNSADPNLQANIDVAYDMNTEQPSLVVTTDEIYVDLQKLGFYADPLKIRTKLDVNLENADPDKLQGNLSMSALQIAFKDKIYPLDSLKLIANHINDSSSIDLLTPLINANLKGVYKLTTLAQSVQGIIAHYTSDSAATDSLPANEALLTGTIQYHEIVRSFVPDLKQLTTTPFRAYLNTEGYKLQAAVLTKNIRYDSYSIDSLNVNVDTKNDSLLYNVSIRQLRNPSVPLHNTFVYGAYKNGNLGWNIRLLDRRRRDNYRIAGTYTTENKISELKLTPGLLLHKQVWNVNEDNVIKFNKDGLMEGNLELKNGNSLLEVKSSEAGGGMPVNIKFTDFSIETLASLIQSDTLLADGFINGTVQIQNTNPFAFTADMTIDSIKVYDQPIGTLKLLAKNTSKDVFNIDATVKGDSTDLTLKGDYTNNKEGNINFVLDMPSVSMSAVQPFLKDIASNMKGNVSGNIAIKGTVSKPEVRGAIDFKEVSLYYLAYNTYVKMPNERITLDEQGVLFQKFTLEDSLKNTIVVDGRIGTTDYQAFKFDMRLNARNFLVVDKRVKPEQLIYGPASIDARLTVKGDMDLPVIDGQVRVVDKSAVTVIIPSEDPEVETRRGIIQFVDKDIKIDSSMLAERKADTTAEANIKGLSASINVDLTPESVLTIVLDEQNGDSLRVAGNASLNLTIDPSGKTSMTGRYTISEGVYVLSLNQFIKRKFNIQKDGTITWTGDPTSATLDLSAVYNVNTSAEQLIKDNSTVTGDRLRQKLPFEVMLYIKGQMLKPTVSFKLDMPEREQNAFDGIVYTRIKQINNDESELNKQVMGLLVLNNFISDNPFSSLQQNTTPESIARRTAGKILSQQLNNLVGNIIKGVDINFDVESQEDYSTGSLENQTNLKVGVSKNLFNDRTTVTVGSSVPIEGSRQSTTGLVGNVTIEYKLTRDGRYRVKAYRRTDNEAFIQGEVVETGVGFTLIMDYNEFKEIFRKSRRGRRTTTTNTPPVPTPTTTPTDNNTNRKNNR